MTHRTAINIALILSIPAIGAVDYFTNVDYSFEIFFLLPTVVLAWTGGRRLAIVAALLASASWGIVDYELRHVLTPAAIIWNVATRVVIFGVVGSWVDLFHRHQTELRSLLARRDEFLTSIAHELRAPVAAIEIAATGLSGASDLGERHRLALRQLLQQARSLTALAEDVLRMGLLEAGSAPLRPEDFDLRRVISELVESEPRVRANLPDGPVVVHADPDAIRRVSTNLLSNAMKYSPAASAVEVALSCGQNSARLSVRDHGIGIPETELSRLFRKYGRLRDPDAGTAAGVGLGLYLSRLVVEASGGEITARSDGPGRGSTFSVSLPLVPASQRAVLEEPAFGR